MKNLLLISILFLSFSLQAQRRTNDDYKFKTPKLYIPTGILVSGFVVNESFGSQMSYKARTSVAVTSVLTSVVVYMILPERVNSSKYKYKRKFRRR